MQDLPLIVCLPPNDLKLFTAILVAAALSMPLFQAKLNKRKAAKD